MFEKIANGLAITTALLSIWTSSIIVDVIATILLVVFILMYREDQKLIEEAARIVAVYGMVDDGEIEEDEA